MYNVTENYINKSKAAGRVYFVQLSIGMSGSLVFGGADVLSLKIVRGQTTGSFALGNTVCASLEATVANRVEVSVNDSIFVYIRFGEGEEQTEWHSLGRFYVDSIKQGLSSKSITAYDAMLRFGRLYNSSLSYPNNLSNILNEICSQAEASLSPSVNLINNATINAKPQGDNKQAFYTRREILGYIAGINGGSAYVDVDGTVNISAPTSTGHSVYYTEVTEQSIQDANYTVEDVVWNASNRTLSVNDNYTVNTVDIYNPLQFSNRTQMLNTLKTKLVGLTFDTVIIKKQGTGIYQLGDIIKYHAPDGITYKMLIMGIVYDFSNGFFSETLYSLAPSASQQRNQGNKVNQESLTSKSVQGTSGNLVGDFGGSYILKWNDPTTLKAEKPNGSEMFTIRQIDNADQFFINAGTNSVAFWSDRIEVKHGNSGIESYHDGRFFVKGSAGQITFNPISGGLLQIQCGSGMFEVNFSQGKITLNGQTVFQTS